MNFLSNLNITYILYAVLIIAAFNAALILLKLKLKFIACANVFLLFFAVIEPSPSDILFISLLIFAVKDKVVTLEKIKKQKIILYFLSGYVLISMISSINMINLKIGTIFFAITLYLILYGIVIFLYSSEKNYLALQRAYIFGTSISALIGILGSMGFFSDYLCYDILRVKGLFKDPNVFGPSFIPSILLLLGDLKSSKIIRGIANKRINIFKSKALSGILICISLIIINFTGLVLSYSRGAYISFLTGLIVWLILNIKKINYKKLAAFSLAAVSFATIIFFGIMNTQAMMFIIDRMGIQKYDFGRFEAQWAGISMAFDHIIGYGPGQYEQAVSKAMGINFSAHSLYARVLLENGVLGFLLLITVILIIIAKLMKARRYEDEKIPIKSSVLISVIISIMVNSIIVDTLHWRHLWLFLGLSLSVTMRYCKDEITEIFKIKGLVYELNGIGIEIISNISRLKRYRNEWNNLLKDEGCTPFTELDYITNWWTFFKNAKHLFILKLSDKEEIIGFCPLIIDKEVLGSVVRFAGFPQANYMDFLLNHEYREKSIDCIMEYLVSLKMHFDFSGIPKDSKNYTAITNYLKNHKIRFFEMEEEVPFIKIGSQNFVDYYKKRFESHKRKEFNRRENRLTNIGRLTYGKLGRNNIDEIFAIHKKRWKKKLDESSFTDKKAKEFYKYLSKKKGLSFKTCINTLKLNNKIIAFKYGFECKGSYISYRICHDDDFALFGPGKIITKKKIEECFDKGLAMYDFGPGDSSYKAEWTDDSKSIVRIIVVGRTFYSRLMYTLKLLIYKTKFILKRSQTIVNFREKKLGKLKYFLSFENIVNKYKNIYLQVKKAGLCKAAKAIITRISKKVYFDERYIVLGKELINKGDNVYKASLEFEFSEFNINDIDELSRVMQIPKNKIVKRLFERKKCFIAKKGDRIVYYGWLDFVQIEIREIKFNMKLKEKSAYLFDGFTDQEYRNMGLSRGGLNDISQYLINHNYSKCYIAVNERNIPSIKSCKNAGFIPELRLRGIKFLNRLKYFSVY